MEHFCAMPWHHICIKTNGDYAVCCQHSQDKQTQKKYNIHFHHIDEWLNSEYLESVQNAFRDNVQHKGCNKCWVVESQGFTSLRQRTSKEYKIFGVNINEPKIHSVEVQLGNVCNLKCLMCNPGSSSSLHKEWQILGEATEYNQDDYIWKDSAFANLIEILKRKPKILNIRGGEPFYEKKLLKLLQNIDDEYINNTILHITTNATTWNSSWKSVIQKFKHVRVMFSVDAIGNAYEYIRYPANWQNVEQNMLEINSLPNTKCLVHAVIMNLNILHLFDLIQWCDKNKIYLDLDLLISPEYLDVANLPFHLRESAIRQCYKMLNYTNEIHLLDILKNTQKLLIDKKDVFYDQKWQNFINFILPRDNLRKTNYKTVLPDTLKKT